jgi:hypothetical protein
VPAERLAAADRFTGTLPSLGLPDVTMALGRAPATPGRLASAEMYPISRGCD